MPLQWIHMLSTRTVKTASRQVVCLNEAGMLNASQLAERRPGRAHRHGDLSEPCCPRGEFACQAIPTLIFSTDVMLGQHLDLQHAILFRAPLHVLATKCGRKAIV